MIDKEIQAFLNDIAERCDPNFRMMYKGIAADYECDGYLTPNQRRSIYRAASFLGIKTTPKGWDAMKGDGPQPEIPTDCFIAPVEAMLDAAEYEPCPGEPVIAANALRAVKAAKVMLDLVSDLIEVLSDYRLHLSDALGFDPDYEAH